MQTRTTAVGGMKALGSNIMKWMGETHRVHPTGRIATLLAGLSVLAVLMISWYALVGVARQQYQIAIFLALLMPACFMTTTSGPDTRTLKPIDYVFAIAGVLSSLWFVFNEGRYEIWMTGFSELTVMDLTAGTILSLLIIELGRRTIGFGLTATVLVLLLYVWLGDWMIGAFRHPPFDFHYFMEMQLITNDGVFGSPLYVAASYAFLFVLFGNFYIISGGGQLFFDVSASLTGRMTGGPAKACVLSSGLYGSISGSPVADVATTGPISIPIMRRIGISPERAASIEATSSTGGSMLPPVMGAVAFVMADFTGIPYAMICLYATLPALAYYFGIFTLVHFDAVKEGQSRLPEDEIIGMKIALARNWTSILPIVALIWLLAKGYSQAYVAAGAVIAVIISSWLAPGRAIGPKKFIQDCVETCYSSVPLTAAVAASGIIIGCIELTGLSGKFTLLLFQLSFGMLIPSLFLAAIILLLLGTGMPTTGVYIMAVALLAPVLVNKFGLPLMPVHLFFLFYACLSAITPPVAVANFSAAAIAGANPFKMTSYACKLAIGGFVLPFFFIFNTGILFVGDWSKIISDTFMGFLLVFLCSVFLHGYVRRTKTPLLLRMVFAVAAFTLIFPSQWLQYSVAAGAMAMFGALLLNAKRHEGETLKAPLGAA